MKTLALPLAMLLFLSSYGQITTTKTAEINNYDSSKNYLNEDARLYKGQELYLKGLSESLREYGYSDMVIDYRESTLKKSNVYEPGGSLGSKYEALTGKYFTVLDVIKGDVINGDYFLKLQEKESKDTLYYGYRANAESHFPFIVTGYFLKLKQTLAGKKFVVTGASTNERINISTGQKALSYATGSIWSVADITIDEKNYNVSAILESPKKEKVLLAINELNNDLYVLEYDTLITSGAKPGDANWQAIINGRVAIGMKKAMCQLSLGKPNDITELKDKSGTYELWSYDIGSLYFRNGILFDKK